MQEINPFVVNHPIEVVALPKKVAVHSSDDLETPLDKLLGTHYLHDRQDKTSVFRHGKKVMYEVMFGRLSDKSRSVFIYIMYSLNKNEDYIDLSSKKVQQDIGMKKRTLIEALKELKACSIITSKSRSIYWVNPMYLFNGNRIEFYRSLNPDNVIVNTVIKNK